MIHWNASEVPDLQDVRFDGVVIQPGFTFTDTFASIEAPTTHPLAATTVYGIVTFELVPTRCGDACDFGDLDCDALISEHEDWIFFHGVLAAIPPDPLELAANSGTCSDGVHEVGWAD